MNATTHTELIKTSSFAKVNKTIKQRGQIRKVWINLTKELKNIYYDEDGNIQYEGEYLEEIIENQENSDILPNASEQPLVKLLEKLLEKSQEKSQEKNLGKLAKEFTIEKFDGKNSNANQWINNFEKECARFEITTDEKKI